MIPERLSAYQSIIPLLDEVTEWSLLRKWALSEVYRVKLNTGESRIIKWGGEEMAREASIYEQLVIPLQLKVPHISGFYELESSVVMIMEDAGNYNLEQQPEPEHFLEAARELARLRERASANLAMNIPSNMISSHTVPATEFLSLLDDLVRSQRISDKSALIRLQTTLPNDLNKLYQTIPLTLVHHDYHAKNLLIQGGSILPIDWSIAYLSPHLGDLYELIKEAYEWGNVSREDMVSAYLNEVSTELSIEQLNWQIRIGGICWLIKSLRWLVYGGTDTIPGSDAWVPDLMKDLEDLIQ